MTTRQPIVPQVLRAFVCLLALGVLTLATQAKQSQYVPQKGLAGHLSQAFKMSEGGQKSGPICAAAVAASLPAPPRLAESPLPPACTAVVYHAVHFPRAFHIRPPPSV